VKRAEVVDGALAPKLTAWDRKVLAALDLAERRSPWQIAEAVDEEDVAYVRSTLNGLEDRRLAWKSPMRGWLRTRTGDAYLEAA